MYEYSCIIERVVDGDTVDVNINLGFDVWTKQRVRLKGVDTPESRTRDLREKKFGKLATARVEELIPVAAPWLSTRTRTAAGSSFGHWLIFTTAPLRQFARR